MKQRAVLALLLLRPNEVVATDRLIDELWGEAPPEDAATALQAHISRLRKALPGGNELLRTQAPGYVLQLAPDQRDLDRFEHLVAKGREQLAAGDAAGASSSLRRALDLWRGRPLADLEDEPFARDASQHLEDAWLDAVEARLDADLALGRHAELVAELRALARAHPLREGVRERLMLGLYRSGRQAEALDVYADTRKTLVEELGLEPGPSLQRLQQAILAQDPALDPPAMPAIRLRRRRWTVAALVGAAAVVIAAVTAVGVFAVRSEAPAPPFTGGVVLALDAHSGDVERRLNVGATPASAAIGEGALWVLDADARTVLRVDRDRGTFETFATGATPTDLAVGRGSVWVGNGRRVASEVFVGPVTSSVARIDAATRTERAEVTLPRSGGSISNQVSNHLAVGRTALWAVAPDFSLARIDLASSEVTNVLRPFPVRAIAAGPAGVWALGVDGAVARIDDATGAVVKQVRVPATSVAAIAVGDADAWVTSPSDGKLWRIAAGPGEAVGALVLAPGADDIALAGGYVWVANPLEGTVTQVSTATSAVVREIPVGGVPRSLAADGDRIWVTLSSAELPAAGGSQAQARGLPATSCEPLLSDGRSAPDLLIASDLMLQGSARVQTTQMAQAIAYVLRRRGFRAGRFRVGYHSCDDSIATTALYDLGKCRANARAYAAQPKLVGVIGTFNSPCAREEIPILNRAAGGGLAMISPSNSDVGLTRVGPGQPAEQLAALYPTGRRTYLRVQPTQDMNVVALAIKVKRLGRAKVALLTDGDTFYGRGALTGAFERAAAQLGLQIVFRETWDPNAPSYAGLADAVARSGAGAVVLTGGLYTNGGQVIRELRATLDRGLPILADEGFTPIALLLHDAGNAARGTYVSVNGLTLERLPEAGRRFVRAFSATQPGAEIRPSSVYAAQAADVLLDAIARSDGTRASVLRELFRTRVENGLLGDFSFDHNGDITERPITILRAERAGGSNAVASSQGAVVDSVVRPAASLVVGAR